MTKREPWARWRWSAADATSLADLVLRVERHWRRNGVQASEAQRRAQRQADTMRRVRGSVECTVTDETRNLDGTLTVNATATSRPVRVEQGWTEPIALFRCDTCNAYRIGGEETFDPDPIGGSWATCRICGDAECYEVGLAQIACSDADEAERRFGNNGPGPDRGL